MERRPRVYHKGRNRRGVHKRRLPTLWPNPRHTLPHGPLLDDFGFLGNQDKIEEILNGTYACPKERDEFTQKFIDELQRPEQAHQHVQISGYMTTDEHIKGWKNMRVGTAASIFGPSFSEIIAGTKNVTIAEVDAAMVSIATLTGYCPHRWSEAIDVMIPKKADYIHVKKLRIIILFHALFNMINKKVAREATQNATKMTAIPSEAYAKHGYRAADCGLNKVLTKTNTIRPLQQRCQTML
jgi:hypothetical protein